MRFVLMMPLLVCGTATARGRCFYRKQYNCGNRCNRLWFGQTCENLAVRLGAGCVIDLPSVPLLHGVTHFLRLALHPACMSRPAGCTYSLIMEKSPSQPGRFVRPPDKRRPFGVFKAADAENAVNALLKSGHRAVMIGRLDQHTAASQFKTEVCNHMAPPITRYQLTLPC